MHILTVLENALEGCLRDLTLQKTCEFRLGKTQAHFVLLLPSYYSYIVLSFTSLKFKNHEFPRGKRTKNEKLLNLERNDNEAAKLKAEMRRERKRGTDSG